MKEEISIELINKLKKHPGKPRDIRDKKLEGFCLRVHASGKLSYSVRYAGSKRMVIGEAGSSAIGLEEARTKAREIRLKYHQGIDPRDEKRLAEIERNNAKTFQDFLNEDYMPFLEARPKGRAKETYNNLTSFTQLLNLKLAEITAGMIERWRTGRRNEGISDSRLNRQLNDLRACLNRAITWDFLKINPLTKIKNGKEDKSRKPKYLTDDQQQALRNALADYGNIKLTTAMILCLNTGIRRQEALRLKWENIDFKEEELTVISSTSKTGQTLTVPLNTEALSVLTTWKKLQPVKSIKGYVFCNKDGGPLNDMRYSIERVLENAKINGKRWHSLRHTCATNLISKDTNLLVVQQILGHANYATTEKYAKAKEKAKRDALNKLVAPAKTGT